MKISQIVTIVRDEDIPDYEIFTPLETKFNVELTGFATHADHRVVIITKKAN